MLTLKEAVERIKQVGMDKVRKNPNQDGKVDIQINLSGNWTTILENVSAKAADDIIRQASNRVLLG